MEQLKSPALRARIDRALRVALALVFGGLAVGAAPTALDAFKTTLDGSVQTLDVETLEGGASPSSPTLVLRGRLAREYAVRFTLRTRRSGQERAERWFYIPLVSPGWTPSSPLRVVVATAPTTLNLTASSQALADAPSYRGVVRELSDELRVEVAHGNRVRVAENAFVLDVSPNAEPSAGDAGLAGFVVAHGAILALWFALTALYGARADEPMLHRYLRRLRRQSAWFFHGAAHVFTLPALVIALSRPETPGQVGVAALGLLVLGCLAGVVRELRRPSAQSPAVSEVLAREGVSLDALAARLEGELAGDFIPLNGVRVLRSGFLFTLPTHGLSLIRYDDIFWVYDTGPRIQRWLVVEYLGSKTPSGQAPCLSHRRALSGAAVARAMRDIAAFAPHVVVGWSLAHESRRADLAAARDRARSAHNVYRQPP